MKCVIRPRMGTWRLDFGPIVFLQRKTITRLLAWIGQVRRGGENTSLSHVQYLYETTSKRQGDIEIKEEGMQDRQR